MKVLFVASEVYSSHGGIQTYNQNFISAMIESNLAKHISVFALIDSEKFERENYFFRGFNRHKPAFLYAFFKERNSFDHIIIGHLNFLPLCIIGRSSKSVVVHGFEAWKKFGYFYKKLLNSVTLISASAYTLDFIKRMNPNVVKKAVVIHNCISREFLFGFQNSFGGLTVENEKKFLLVSRLNSSEEYKGILGTLNSFVILLGLHKDIRLDIIGTGDLLEELKGKYSHKSIHFHGRVEDVHNYFRSADCFILPSTKEGFGIVYLEAMLYGLPIVACDVGGQTDFLKNNANAVLLRNNSEEAIVASLESILESEDTWNRFLNFGNSGCDFVMNNYLPDHFRIMVSEFMKRIC